MGAGEINRINPERHSKIVTAGIPISHDVEGLGLYPVIWVNRLDKVIMVYDRPIGSLHLSKEYFDKSQLEQISEETKNHQWEPIRIEQINEEQQISNANGGVLYLTSKQEQFANKLAKEHGMFWSGAGMNGS